MQAARSSANAREILQTTTINKIFHNAHMNMRPAFLKLLVLAWLYPAWSASAERGDQRNLLDIPLTSVAKAVESQERTPWGNARAKIAYGFDEKNSTVHFTRFNFAQTRQIDPKKIDQTIEYFKNNYNCTAKKSNRTFSFNPSCKVSAQLVWEGLCASGERYLNVQFIANGQLYEVGATRLMKQSEHNLARTVEDLAGRCQGPKTEKAH